MSRIGTTIYGLASAVSNQSAVTVYRISGPESFKVIEDLSSSLVDKRAGPEPNKCQVMKLYYSNERDGSTKREFLDEALVIWFKQPRSYTGEDVVEVHTHGGHETARVMAKAFHNLGYIKSAEPGEFSYRAVLNGKMSVFKAEKISSLVSAETPFERELACQGVIGAARQEELIWNNWRARLLSIISRVEVGLDFEDVELTDTQMLSVINDANLLRDEVCVQIAKAKNAIQKVQKSRIAIIGPPNVGKSSLMNYLSQDEVSIVTNLAGTTRDIVTKEIILGKKKIELVDTAGIRSDTKNPVELIGIEKSL